MSPTSIFDVKLRCQVNAALKLYYTLTLLTVKLALLCTKTQDYLMRNESMVCNNGSVLSDASLASLKLIQGLLKHEMSGDQNCQDGILCETLQSVNQLGRIGQLFSKALK